MPKDKDKIDKRGLKRCSKNRAMFQANIKIGFHSTVVGVKAETMMTKLQGSGEDEAAEPIPHRP